MSVLPDLTSRLIQGGHVDELTLVVVVVHLLHSVLVALSTAECVAGHSLISGDRTVLFLVIIITGEVLMVSMWMVCL